MKKEKNLSFMAVPFLHYDKKLSLLVFLLTYDIRECPAARLLVKNTNNGGKTEGNVNSPQSTQRMHKGHKDHPAL
jgi:hypothetical protein